MQTAGKIEMFGKPGAKLVIMAATAASPLWGKQAVHETSDLQEGSLSAAEHQICVLPSSLGSCSTICK